MTPTPSPQTRTSRSLSPRVRTIAALCALATFIAAPRAVEQGQAPAPTGRGIQPNLEHPVLPIGSPIPEFALPGIDGKTHRLSEYTKTKLLAIVFESNHCPVSQLYEGRVEKLHQDYKAKGVTIVAINPNNPKTVRLDELGYTDVTDSLAEMKVRSAFRGIDWPYLYDGETQEVSAKFGAVATPHIFIFGPDRTLQYQGRIDDNQREELVKTQDARNAIEALLAGRPVPTPQTTAFGCTTKWLSKASGVEQEWARIQAEPVTVEPVGADDLKTAALESDRQGHAGEFLVHRLRPLRGSVPGSRDDVPHVSQAGVRSRDGEHQPARGRAGRARLPQEAVRVQSK